MNILWTFCFLLSKYAYYLPVWRIRWILPLKLEKKNPNRICQICHITQGNKSMLYAFSLLAQLKHSCHDIHNSGIWVSILDFRSNHRRFQIKNFLQNFANSQENNCVSDNWDSFLIKLQAQAKLLPQVNAYGRLFRDSSIVVKRQLKTNKLLK